MKILIVYVHHEPKSFSAALKNLAIEVLTAQGHTLKISDLYGMHFNPVGDNRDFLKPQDSTYINYMLEQKNAAASGSFSKDILEEQAKVKWADLIMINTPVWWFSTPAILKGWFDRIFAAGVTWDFGAIYDQGLLRGKKAMLTMTTGGPEEFYQPTGAHHASIEQILHPIQYGTLYFCGLDVLPPFVAWSVFQAGEAGRKQYLADYKERLLSLEALIPILKHPAS